MIDAQHTQHEHSADALSDEEFYNLAKQKEPHGCPVISKALIKWIMSVAKDKTHAYHQRVMDLENYDRLNAGDVLRRLRAMKEIP